MRAEGKTIWRNGAGNDSNSESGLSIAPSQLREQCRRCQRTFYLRLSGNCLNEHRDDDQKLFFGEKACMSYIHRSTRIPKVLLRELMQDFYQQQCQ